MEKRGDIKRRETIRSLNKWLRNLNKDNVSSVGSFRGTNSDRDFVLRGIKRDIDILGGKLEIVAVLNGKRKHVLFY